MIQLLYFSCWAQSRYQKSALLSIKVGKRAPTFAKNYYPGTKIHIFDTVNRTQLPMIEIAFNESISKSFLLSSYTGHQTQPYMEDIRILFTFQLLSNTQKIYDKYCHEKSDGQKHYLCEGIKDYIRSQQEFLAQFQRNEQIEEIRQLQAEQSRIQKDLCDQIMSTQKYSLSMGKIVLIIVIFLFIGFLIGRHDQPKKGNILTNIFYSDKDGKYEDEQKTYHSGKKIQSKQKSKKTIEQNMKIKKNSKNQKNKST